MEHEFNFIQIRVGKIDWQFAFNKRGLWFNGTKVWTGPGKRVFGRLRIKWPSKGSWQTLVYANVGLAKAAAKRFRAKGCTCRVEASEYGGNP